MKEFVVTTGATIGCTTGSVRPTLTHLFHVDYSFSFHVKKQNDEVPRTRLDLVRLNKKVREGGSHMRMAFSLQPRFEEPLSGPGAGRNAI